MKSIDTETIKCSRCGVELDVPVYQDNEKTKYGMKYCHQCGAKLHEEAIQLSDLKEALKLIREYKADNAKQREQIAEYKRLLKAAVEDMQWVNENTQDADGTCTMRKGKGCGDCPLDINGDLWCKWKHEDEALKLIGEENNDEP